MPIWMVQTGLCMICFGLWGFFSKLALDNMPAKTTLVFQTVGIAIVTLFLLKPAINKVPVSYPGLVYATITGIAFTVGSILFFLATKEHGKVSIIVTVTALYPIITIALAWLFLREPITARQGLGMLFALTATLLLSSE